VEREKRREAVEGISGHGGPKIAKDGTTRGRPENGISQAARELGIPETTVKRAVAAESLAPEVKAVADAEDIGTVARAKGDRNIRHPFGQGVTSVVPPPTPSRLRPRRNPLIAFNSAVVAELHDPNY
jgi:hypothetical protein